MQKRGGWLPARRKGADSCKKVQQNVPEDGDRLKDMEGVLLFDLRHDGHEKVRAQVFTDSCQIMQDGNAMVPELGFGTYATVWMLDRRLGSPRGVSLPSHQKLRRAEDTAAYDNLPAGRN